MISRVSRKGEAGAGETAAPAAGPSSRDRAPGRLWSWLARRTAASSIGDGGSRRDYFGAPDRATAVASTLASGSGRPLEPSTRAFFGARFGRDFSDVRIHSDGRAAASARAVNALAYTVGSDVVFGGGAYAPGSAAGQRLLAHELAHVVQQTGGGAPASHGEGLGRARSLSRAAAPAPRADETTGALAVSEPGDSSEREADRAADAVLAGPERARAVTLSPAPPSRVARFPLGGLMPLTADHDQHVTETISNAPARFSAWNGTFGWDSRFHLLILPLLHYLRVSVRIYTTATDAVKTAWKDAVEGRWSNRFGLAVEDPTVHARRECYPITIGLDFVDDPARADFTVNPSTPGSTSGGRAGQGGTTSMTDWGTADTVDVTHEFGHMLGNREDYFTTNGTDFTLGGTRQGFRDVGGGIMNNPAENPFAQHYESIRTTAVAALGVPDRTVTVRPIDDCASSGLGDFPTPQSGPNATAVA